MAGEPGAKALSWRSGWAVPMKEAADVFDDWARQGRAEGMEQGHGQTAGPLLSSLPIGGRDRFLDLGCGNGWAARAAAARGAESLGVDASKEMVERAQSAADGAGLQRAHFQVGDFARLEAPDGHFTLAWSMEALYYAPDPDAVLAEVRRVLAPGGSMHMIIDHYQENEASHSWSGDLDVHMDLRSEADWVAAFEAAGFTEVQAQRLRSDDPAADAWKREQGSLYVHGTTPQD